MRNALVVTVLALLPVHGAEALELSGRAMGTTWAVKWVKSESSAASHGMEQRITARLETLENQFSTYRPSSELSRFNATRSTEWFSVSSEVAQLASEARAISEITGGAFDVTVDPVVRLWGFGPAGRGRVVPTLEAIVETRARVDWRRLEVKPEPAALRRGRDGVTADFSSLAKGFAVDALSELLRESGAPNHFVRIGGDMRTGGHAADGAPWRVGVETPEDAKRAVAVVVPLAGEALSTAGDYRNYFEHEGRRYGHIIDPRTGYPVSGALASVAVIHASSCARSSALATAIFVLGAEEGYRFAVREKLACLFFIRNGAGFERRATPVFAAREP